MNRDGKLARDGDSRAFEAHQFSVFETHTRKALSVEAPVKITVAAS
jgi:hypothetical protein